MLSAAAGEAVIRSQTISLTAGWNAVFLEVTPTENAPDSLFAGTPIDMAATYFPTLTGVRFIADPAELSWKKPAWGVWYAPGRPEAAFNTLEGVTGNRAYLLHASRAAEWTVSGAVRYQPLVWQPNSFNFVGLPVDPANPPTFAKYFGPSRAHAGGRFYRLVSDKWHKVTAPASERLRAGEAYWVYCAGGSTYQGPVSIEFIGQGALEFGALLDTEKVTIRNVGEAPVEIVVEAGPGLPPLRRIRFDRQSLVRVAEPLPASLSLGELPAGMARILTLQIRREAMGEESAAGLLTFRSGNGLLYRLPVTASRTE